MSSVTPVVEINTKDEFRAACAEYKIECGERGRFPQKALAGALVKAALAGDIKLIDSAFFKPNAIVLGEHKFTRAAKGDVSYTITYTVKDVEGEQSLTLTENEIRSYLPNVKGMISAAFATMAVALHLNADEDAALLSVVTTITVSDVTRVESAPAEKSAETTEEAPKGETTGEREDDAVHASEEVINAVIAMAEESVKPKRASRKPRSAAAKSKTLASA